MIDFACRECGRYFKVSDDKAGLKGSCPDCGAQISVPVLDEDIVFAQPFIDESNALDFELREIYQSLLLLRGHLNLCGSQVAEGHNIFFATFRTAEKRMHTVSAVQLAQGDPINCFATIGDANKLSKQQIIDVLKQFHYNGVLFSAGINEDNELVAQIVYPQPPREAAAVCTGMLSLAKFGDTVERDFFGADLN